MLARYRARTNKRGLQRFKRAAKLIQHAVRNRKKKTTMTAKLAIAVEEARMDKQVTTLRDKVSACSVSGRAPDENTLLEVESYVAVCLLPLLLHTHTLTLSVFLAECWII